MLNLLLGQVYISSARLPVTQREVLTVAHKLKKQESGIFQSLRHFFTKRQSKKKGGLTRWFYINAGRILAVALR